MYEVEVEGFAAMTAEEAKKMEGSEESNSKCKEMVDTVQLQPKYRGVKAMPFIIGNETFEKLGTIGTSTNMMVYFTTVFNMKRVTAATLINVWNGSCNFTPLLGAFLSDSYFGRYKTLGVASIASLTGMFLLVLTAAIPSLHPPHCGAREARFCTGATPFQLAFLLGGLGFLVIGAGGIRSCNLAFGADQFDPTTKSGKRGIDSFFNWYFFTFTFAMMIGVTLIVYVQDSVSWSIGFAVPTCLMFLSCVFFFVGSKIYVKIKPEGSPFKSIVQVIAAAIKKRGLNYPDDPQCSLFSPPHNNSLNSKLPYTSQFRCLDKAAIITKEDPINADGSSGDPWGLCSIQQVEEVKCILRVIPIWSSCMFYNVATVQQQTYAVLQALQSDRYIGNFQIPSASFIIFSMLTLTIWIPIYDRLVVPFLRRITKKEGGMTLLQRMGIGVFLSVITMLVSGLVERRRRSTALRYSTLGTASGGGAISAMSALWLIPQLSISGLSEAFTAVGQMEFYYKQFPENLRSLAASLFFLGVAGSNYLSSLLVVIIHRVTRGQGNWLAEDLNKGRLEYFYFLIGIIGILNFGYFLLCAKWYKYKQKDGVLQEIALEPKESKVEHV